MNDKDLLEFCDSLVDANRARNELWAEIDRMVNLEYELPEAFKHIPGHHKVTRPDPYEDILTATNALAVTEPQIRIDPLINNLANKAKANEREKWLLWQLKKLDNRTGGSVIKKIIESAMKYHAVCFSTQHVEYAWKAKTQVSGKQRAFRRAHSPFSWTYYNPQNVFWQHSEYGLERVLACSVEPLQSVMDEYGKAASELERKIKGAGKKADTFRYVTKWYYCDHDVIRVWAVPSAAPSMAKPNGKEAVFLLKAENDLGFIPFVCEEVTSTDAKDTHKPLLYATHKSGWWHTQNALETILMTQVIQHAGDPEWIEETQTGESKVRYEYEHLVGGVAVVPPGHRLQKTSKTQLDQGLLTQAERLGGFQQRTGAARSLTGGVGVEGFAQQNQLISVSGATIAQGHGLSERAIAEGLLQILAWAVKAEPADQPMYVMGRDPQMPEDGYGLIPGEVDLGTTYIEVVLKAQNTLGELQAANAAAIMRQFGYSNETLMEKTGVGDPQEEMKRRRFEEFSEVVFQQEVKRLSAATDLEIQAQQMEMQFQLQQAMSQPQPPAPPTNEIYSNPQSMAPPSGVPAGPGFNSNGALAPAMVAPGTGAPQEMM